MFFQIVVACCIWQATGPDYSIALESSAVQLESTLIKKVSTFIPIISRSLEIKHSLRYNNNSWH